MVGCRVIARIELLCSAYDKSFIKLINAEGTDVSMGLVWFRKILILL